MKKALKTIATLAICALIALPCGVAIHKAGGNVNEPVAAVAVITRGSRGETVKTIQKKLKRWGYYKGAVDGIYGSQTVAAVKYFQRKNGLTADGIVGAKTLAALGMPKSALNGSGTSGSGTSGTGGSSGGSSGSGSSAYSNSDIQLMARLVYGEARGESYTGQIAVAAVVLNRVKNSAFPNTISGVIYQPYAFTAVSDGQINLTPDSKAINAVKEAMNGYDPTYGALYYYNPVTATSAWIFSRKTTVQIGRHVFAV